jgi:oligoendopeptidase F
MEAVHSKPVAKKTVPLFMKQLNPVKQAREGISSIKRLCSPKILAKLTNHRLRLKWALELGKALILVDQAGTLCTIQYGQQTDAPGALGCYNRFVKKISPRILEAEELARKAVLKVYDGKQVPTFLTSYFNQATKLTGIYRKENLDLLAEEDTVGNTFSVLVSNLKVPLAGVSENLDAACSRFPSAPCEEREQLWLSVWDARRSLSSKLHATVDRLIQLRGEIHARAASHLRIEDYFYTRLQSHFTSSDTSRLCESIEATVVPAVRDYFERTRRVLSVPELRPWDVSITRYFEMRPLLNPLPSFSSPQDQVANIIEVLSCINPALGSAFKEGLRKGALDIWLRRGKSSTPIAANLAYSRAPFMSTHANTHAESYSTIVHEFGHYFHYLQANKHIFGPNRVHIPIEVAELGSIGLEHLVAAELLTNPRWKESPLHVSIAQQLILSTAISHAYAAQLLLFQRWLYENPHHDHQERESQWISLDKRFGPKIQWEGLEQFRGMQWQQQAHIFKYPFYYPQYTFAGFGAAGLLARYMSESHEAVVNDFIRGLSAGGELSPAEMYGQMSLPFIPGERELQSIVEILSRFPN